MKIIALQAENIKKLVAIEIRPDGNLVQITGKNGDGKTSVLDSIWWALAGSTNIQDAPIRNGQKKARIKLDMGEIVVTRTFKKDESGETSSAITVESAEGVKFSSPQSMLDGLLGELSFDPLAFSRLPARAQFDTLKKFCPKVDFEKIEAMQKADFEARTLLNRQAKEARAEAHGAQDDMEIPQKVDISTLTKELSDAGEKNGKIETAKLARQQAFEKIEDLKSRSINLVKNAEIQAKKIIEDAEKQAKALTREAINIEVEVENLPEPGEPIDTAELRQKIDEAQDRNSQIDDLADEVNAAKKASRLEKEADALTKKMEEREADKQEKIAAAKLPVKEISFGDGSILYKKLPFDQASDAEKLKVSIAIAMALNPKMRIIRVRDGSLLDAESMRVIEKMANEKDYQVWVERVDDSGKVGFVMEEGQVKTPAAA